MADALPAATPAPPRRRLRKLLRVGLVVFVLLAVLVWFAPAIIARTALLNVILAKAGADLNGTVTAEGASLSWFGPVDLHGVKVTDVDGNPVLTAASVSTSRTLFQLLTDRSDLGTFTINEPKLDVTVAGGTTNVETVIRKYLDDDTPAKPNRTPVKVELSGGIVVLREPAANVEHSLTGLEVTLAVPKSCAEAVTLTASAVGGDGKLGLSAEFLHGGAVKFTATEFPVGHLAALVHRFDPNTTASGKLTATLDTTWKTEDGKPLSLSVDGTAAATGVRLAGSWLGPDVLALESVSAPCKLTYANGVLAVEKSKLDCDVGTFEFVGTLDPSVDPEKLADQAGLRLKANLDLAKLATLVPRSLRLKPGTAIRTGTVAVAVSSTAGKDGPTWSGKVVASKLEGTRDGQPLVWESPLSATFAGRLRADKTPHFDTLEIRSDFLNVNARGEPEAFEVAARVDLGALGAKLTEFADVGKLKLNGDAVVRATATKMPAGGFKVEGTATCDELVVSDGAGFDLREPKIAVTYAATAERGKDGRVRLDAADVGVVAGADRLGAKLLKPVADVRAMSSGEASVSLVGDLARWQTRLGRLIGLPADYTLGGTGTVAGTVGFDDAAYSVAPLSANLTDAVFRMTGVLHLSERQLVVKSESLRFDRKTKAVTFNGSEVTCETIRASVPKLELARQPGGGYGATGTARVHQAQLEPLQRSLLLRSKDGSDAVRGVAVGNVTLDAMGDRYGFTADLNVTDFALGPPQNPTWAEPRVSVKADGAFDVPADTLTLKSAHLARDGLAADVSGRIARLSTVAAAELSGTLTSDLSKVEPTLKEYMGKTAQVRGTSTKPIKLIGDLNGADVTKLAGEVTVGWQSIKAYGFDVGPGELGGTLKEGIVYMSSVEATFGGGKVKVTPAASLRPGERFLNFGKGKVIDTAKLTPAACADAIGYALPAIANAAQADGTFSFDLDDSRIPFASPSSGVVAGRLTVHRANVSPGPVVSQILQVVGINNATVTLSQNNVVPVEFKNGRVYHRDFTMTVDGVVIKTSGSVGVDGTLRMEVDLPLSGKVAGLLPNNQRLREALAKQSLRIPVGGTLARPALDVNAYQNQLAKLIRDAAKDTAAGAVDDLLKKGADDLLKKGLGGFLPKK